VLARGGRDPGRIHGLGVEAEAWRMAAVVLPAAAALNLDRLGLTCWWDGGGR
jgi:hypothetical protein